jgi:hypothetical protein
MPTSEDIKPGAPTARYMESDRAAQLADGKWRPGSSRRAIFPTDISLCWYAACPLLMLVARGS